MDLEQVRSLITNSRPEDWERIRHNSYFLPRHSTDAVAEDTESVKVDEHEVLVVYKPDVDLRLAWGLVEEPDLHVEWAPPWPNPKVARLFVDTFWAGALIDREVVYSVDGGRCYLPEQDRDGASTGVIDGVTSGFVVDEAVARRARLINELTSSQGVEFDSYMQQARFVTARPKH